MPDIFLELLEIQGQLLEIQGPLAALNRLDCRGRTEAERQKLCSPSLEVS